MNIIFTDIDGVLNPHWKKKWSSKAITLYNSLCKKYDLKPVITSTWRLNFTKEQLQEIFIKQGIDVIIYDYTPWLENRTRGEEILEWLSKNRVDNYVVIDDRVYDIEPHIEVSKVFKCTSWLGLTRNEIKLIENYL